LDKWAPYEFDSEEKRIFERVFPEAQQTPNQKSYVKIRKNRCEINSFRIVR
jgi:tRNA threonylcarbamoyladenosine modification (KEOPS) complex  Pcc1 subunit